MPGDETVVRDFIYLDYSRVKSLAAQLGVPESRGTASSSGRADLADRERTFVALESVNHPVLIAAHRPERQPNGRTKEKRMLSMDPDIADLVRVAEKAELASAPHPLGDAAE